MLSSLLACCEPLVQVCSERLLIIHRACISSFLRLYYSIQLFKTVDVTFHIADLFWSAILEGASAILVASFPVLPKLYQFIRGKSSAGRSSRPSYQATTDPSSTGQSSLKQGRAYNQSNIPSTDLEMDLQVRHQ